MNQPRSQLAIVLALGVLAATAIADQPVPSQDKKPAAPKALPTGFSGSRLPQTYGGARVPSTFGGARLPHDFGALRTRPISPRKLPYDFGGVRLPFDFGGVRSEAPRRQGEVEHVFEPPVEPPKNTVTVTGPRGVPITTHLLDDQGRPITPASSLPVSVYAKLVERAEAARRGMQGPEVVNRQDTVLVQSQDQPQQDEQRTPAEELKRSLEGSEQPVRPAGSMGHELEREKIEAQKKAAGWVDGKPPAPKTDIERARDLIAHGKYEQSIAPLRAYLKASPDDADTSRLLAFALLACDDVDNGTAMLRSLYRRDPLFAERPFDYAFYAIESRRVREAYTRCVAAANRTQIGSAWLAAAVLAQSEGRLKLARTMIERAAKVGLENDIVDPFVASLDKAIAQADRAAKARRSGLAADQPPAKPDAAPTSADPAPKR